MVAGKGRDPEAAAEQGGHGFLREARGRVRSCAFVLSLLLSAWRRRAAARPGVQMDGFGRGALRGVGGAGLGRYLERR